MAFTEVDEEQIGLLHFSRLFSHLAKAKERKWKTRLSWAFLEVIFFFHSFSESWFKLLSWSNRVYSRARPCGISTIWNKMPHKIFLAASNEAPKKRPKDKHYFFFKYWKASLTTTLIWWPLYKFTLNFYSLLLYQLSFSSLLESLFQKTNIRDSAVIRAQAFSVAQNVPKWRQRVNKPSCPFLKKGPLKLQKGTHLTLIGQFL